MQLTTDTKTWDSARADIDFGENGTVGVTMHKNYVQLAFSANDNFTLISFSPDTASHPQVAVHAYGDRIPNDDDGSPDLELFIGNEIKSGSGSYSVMPFELMEEVKWFVGRAQINHATVMGTSEQAEALRDQQEAENKRVRKLIKILRIAEKA